jgi:Acetyltransferase (GNAT) domain
MGWRVITTLATKEWEAYLARFPKHDIYFLAEYHQAYEANGDGQACAFVAETAQNLLFYPFFVRRIEKVGAEPLSNDWYDIETVYGYSGPLCTTTDPHFLTEAWAAFAGWCAESRIVAEFVRFNPLLENHQYADPAGRVLLNRETVALRLDCTEEELWTNYPTTQRNMVRKALRRNLTCEESATVENLAVFRDLYQTTMQRVKSQTYYLFSNAYFEILGATLAQQMRLFLVRDQSHIVAAALFLIHGEHIHYHLAASDEAYRDSGANNLLLHTVSLWGGTQGLRRLHLGGGRSARPDDSLLRFKASISRLRLPFYVGQCVRNPSMYQRLRTAWLRQYGANAPPDYFMLYRTEVKNEPG